MQKKDTTLRRELSFIEAIVLSIGIMAPSYTDLSPFSSINDDHEQKAQQQ